MNYNYNIENKSYISIFYFQNNSSESNPLEKLLLIEKKLLRNFQIFFSLEYSFFMSKIIFLWIIPIFIKE